VVAIRADYLIQLWVAFLLLSGIWGYTFVAAAIFLVLGFSTGEVAGIFLVPGLIIFALVTLAMGPASPRQGCSCSADGSFVTRPGRAGRGRRPARVGNSRGEGGSASPVRTETIMESRCTGGSGR
jgi:hypothetical protein